MEEEHICRWRRLGVSPEKFIKPRWSCDAYSVVQQAPLRLCIVVDIRCDSPLNDRQAKGGGKNIMNANVSKDIQRPHGRRERMLCTTHQSFDLSQQAL